LSKPSFLADLSEKTAAVLPIFLSTFINIPVRFDHNNIDTDGICCIHTLEFFNSTSSGPDMLKQQYNLKQTANPHFSKDFNPFRKGNTMKRLIFTILVMAILGSA
jgi:hypothetical protein